LEEHKSKDKLASLHMAQALVRKPINVSAGVHTTAALRCHHAGDSGKVMEMVLGRRRTSRQPIANKLETSGMHS
jgi:hypothetical protein